MLYHLEIKLEMYRIRKLLAEVKLAVSGIYKSIVHITPTKRFVEALPSISWPRMLWLLFYS